jgi:hypothetical protein
VYHIELRQFPHNLCHFNLDEGALGAIVKAWTTEPWVEIEERKWNPHQAKLRILEGPEIPLGQLTMGRGWRAAERNGTDVTDRVLGAATEAARAAAQGAVQQQQQPDATLEADSLGLELLSLLADGPAPLYYAWRLAAKRFPERSPGECLILAERSVGSLLKGHLIVLLAPAPALPEGSGKNAPDGVPVGEPELEPALRAHESWAPPGEATAVHMRRA